MCTIDDNHMMYGSCDMEHEGQNFLSFWTIFCTFTPLITQKVKTLKKLKKHLEILSLYTCVPWMTITWCMVPEIWSVTDRTFCHFGPFFPFNPPNNLKIKKWKKTPGDSIILHMCTINDSHRAADRTFRHFEPFIYVPIWVLLILGAHLFSRSNSS